MKQRALRRAGFWVGRITEAGIVVVSVAYVTTGELQLLAAWELLAALYLSVGFVWAWNGRPGPRASKAVASVIARWSWVLPLVSSFAGVNQAILALLSRGNGSQNDALLGVAASIGVVMSWALLHAGFARMYESIEAEAGLEVLKFPGNAEPAHLDYLYFAFTVGTSFATSDVNVLTLPARRIVLIHGIVSFFYNALVVAVAFQVLQSAVVA